MLGFGFNKNKVLANAERYVQQGKLQNAITEYEKITKADPKDLTVLNTIGDLYARVGHVEQATDYFRRVGDRYSSDGFTVKAIAMYKKLTKLNPQAYDCVQRLAELYTQQGLYSDARQQYLVVADQFMRSNQLQDAARIFQRVLELDPENTTMQNKLADLYEKVGNKDEARNMFFRSADSLYARGSLPQADEALGRVLALDPHNSRALMLRGQISMEGGDAAGAITWLEQVADLETNPDGLKELVRAYLKANRLADAERQARTLLIHYKDIWGIAVTVDALMQNGKFLPALKLLDEFADRLVAANDSGTAEMLHNCIGRVKDDATALDLLRKLFIKLGQKAYLNEISELLAHALVQKGDLKRARDIYRELAELEPENPVHAQNYRQLSAKLGDDPLSKPLAKEQANAPMMVEELDSTSAEIEQEWAPDVEAAVRAALTDSELFDSYNLPAKSIAPLEAVLPKAPGDVRLNQRLAGLYRKANRPKDASRCCVILQKMFEHYGHPDRAKEFASLALKYAGQAGIPIPFVDITPWLPEPKAAAPAPAAPATVEHTFEIEVETPAADANLPEFAVAASTNQEIDISDDWETHTDEPVKTVEGAPQELVEEIQFYLGQGMVDEAKVAIKKLEAIAPAFSKLREWKAKLASPAAVQADEDHVLSLDDTQTVAAKPPAEQGMGGFVSDLEDALGDDFNVAGAPAKPAAAAPSKPAAATSRPTPPPPAPPPAVRPQVAAAASAPAPVAEELPAVDLFADPGASDMLGDLFAEFKEDVEEGAADYGDPDTHYNLGMAFKEMGLMDEAIGELQKVCQAVDHGVPFSQAFQAYTWLAHCLIEKGVPDAAYRWYEKALTIAPDQETRTAIHYELGSAYEAAGNRPQALQHFMEVYGVNIDYRDVAERIKGVRS
ncbi:Tetratricopeptide repeat protein [Candidatus Koribacter versatilis Ellin345]|uniref:Tetratricopeptide repeat protein n=1 Tax=Koribacter versatilis (strain Ellin345) TaxID=204669 RepID=Q1IIC0_KORVE|nr:tetratricopeptide repeat protein [Candidatus Koribacter versatilis]ABF43380.1 Tetratricopeptide repeat protein [Candidatus Koribacter versatilis Ellin345]